MTSASKSVLHQVISFITTGPSYKSKYIDLYIDHQLWCFNWQLRLQESKAKIDWYQSFVYYLTFAWLLPSFARNRHGLCLNY